MTNMSQIKCDDMASMACSDIANRHVMTWKTSYVMTSRACNRIIVFRQESLFDTKLFNNKNYCNCFIHV